MKTPIKFINNNNFTKPVYIRINDKDTESFIADIETFIIPKVTGFVYPKTSSKEDIEELEDMEHLPYFR